MDKKSFVIRNYHGLSVKLPALAIKTKEGLKNNPLKFIPAAIPVSDAALATLIKNNQEAYANWKSGGAPEELLFIAERVSFRVSCYFKNPSINSRQEPFS